MRDEVSVLMDAPASVVWALISEVTNIGRFSPETFDAEWLDGADGPAVGVRFRGHVKRNGRGPVYWTNCTIIDSEPGKSFGFTVYAGSRPVNTWRYQFAASGDGTEATESFELTPTMFTKVY